MKRHSIFLICLVAVSLACTQVVLTPTSTPSAIIPVRPPHTATAAATATPQRQRASVVVPVVNVRKSPGGEVVGQIYAGQTFAVLERSGDWVRIAGGWVWAGCLGIGSRGCEAK